MVTAPKACGAFLDVGPPVLCIPKLGTNNYWAHQELINHPQVAVQHNIPGNVANWFHLVESENCGHLEDSIRMCENVDEEPDAGTDERVNILK